MLQAITVYCSSSTHLDPGFHELASAVGIELARRGITLVYGGGGVGLMGEIARTCQDHGGAVIGVITQTLKDLERGYEACDELLVVETMRERKKLMMQKGEAFLVLPGGVGTYEEFFEVLAGRIVGEHSKPIGIVNADHYYDPMINMILHGIKHRFIKPAVFEELLHIDPDPVKILDQLIADEPQAIDNDRILPMGKQR